MIRARSRSSLAGSRGLDRWKKRNKSQKQQNAENKENKLRKQARKRAKLLASKGPPKSKRTLELCVFWSKIIHRPEWIEAWIKNTSEARRKKILLRTAKHSKYSTIRRLVTYAGKDKWKKWELLTTQEKKKIKKEKRTNYRKYF